MLTVHCTSHTNPFHINFNLLFSVFSHCWVTFGNKDTLFGLENMLWVKIDPYTTLKKFQVIFRGSKKVLELESCWSRAGYFGFPYHHNMHSRVILQSGALTKVLARIWSWSPASSSMTLQKCDCSVSKIANTEYYF